MEYCQNFKTEESQIKDIGRIFIFLNIGKSLIILSNKYPKTHGSTTIQVLHLPHF